MLVNACMLTAEWLKGGAICTCSGLQDDGLEGIMPMPEGPDQREPIGGGCLHGEADGLRPCQIGVCIVCEPCSTFHHVPSAHGSSTSEPPAFKIHKVACGACQSGCVLAVLRQTCVHTPLLSTCAWRQKKAAWVCRRMFHYGWGQAYCLLSQGVKEGPFPAKVGGSWGQLFAARLFVIFCC